MQDETRQYLDGLGFVDPAGDVTRGKIAEACATKLLEVANATTETDVQEMALLVSELRHQVLGSGPNDEVDHDLDGIVGQLTSPRGKTQMALTNGYMLCSAPVTRKLGNGDALTITRRGRFVSAD